MKISKLLMAAALSLFASVANSSTVFSPVDGDVNFLVNPGFTLGGLSLAIFNDSEAVAAGAQITTSTGLLDINMAVVGFAEGGVIDFLGNVGVGGTYQASNQLSLFNLDAINDDFIVGISNDGGLTWWADTNHLGGPANSALLSFSISGSDTIVVDVQTVVPVPAAAWLFGSGLIGLVGIARRQV